MELQRNLDLAGIVDLYYITPKGNFFYATISASSATIPKIIGDKPPYQIYMRAESLTDEVVYDAVEALSKHAGKNYLLKKE